MTNFVLGLLTPVAGWLVFLGLRFALGCSCYYLSKSIQKGMQDYDC